MEILRGYLPTTTVRSVRWTRRSSRGRSGTRRSSHGRSVVRTTRWSSRGRSVVRTTRRSSRGRSGMDRRSCRHQRRAVDTTDNSRKTDSARNLQRYRQRTSLTSQLTHHHHYHHYHYHHRHRHHQFICSKIINVMNGSAKHVVGEKSNKAEDTSLHGIYTTINFTRYSVTEVGASSAAGWAWSLHGKQT